MPRPGTVSKTKEVATLSGSGNSYTVVYSGRPNLKYSEWVARWLYKDGVVVGAQFKPVVYQGDTNTGSVLFDPQDVDQDRTVVYVWTFPDSHTAVSNVLEI